MIRDWSAHPLCLRWLMPLLKHLFGSWLRHIVRSPLRISPQEPATPGSGNWHASDRQLSSSRSKLRNTKSASDSAQSSHDRHGNNEHRPVY